MCVQSTPFQEPRSSRRSFYALPLAECGLPSQKHPALYSMKVKVAQVCPSLCDPMDYTVHGILQARILEWVAFPFFQGIFPTQGLNPGTLALQADSLPAEPQGKLQLQK